MPARNKIGPHVIKHPGTLKADAKRAHKSLDAEAKHLSHSSNPHTRGKGLFYENIVKPHIKKARK